MVRNSQKPKVISMGNYKRTIVQPPTHIIEKERVQRTSAEEAFEFYRIGNRKLSARRMQGGQWLKKGMVRYAELYGNPELASAIRAMPVQRIQWMYEQGIIIPEQYFAYVDEIFDEIGSVVNDSGASVSSLQFYVQEYNRLYQAGLAERRSRRSARGWA